MISVTKLLFAREYFGDRLRYSRGAHQMRDGTALGLGPVVVWNSTRTCNLKCRHCYMNADAKRYRDELTTEEAKRFMDDLADFKVPVLLFSGGEPLEKSSAGTRNAAKSSMKFFASAVESSPKIMM